MKKNHVFGQYASNVWRKTLKVMKLTILLVLLGIFSVSAEGYGQGGNISLKMEHVSLDDILQELKAHSEYTFVYSDQQVENVQLEVFEVKDANLEVVMNECLQGTDLEFYVENSVVIIRKKTPVVIEEVKQEKKELKGTVTDADGNTLPGVSVVVKGTTTGVATDINGKYTLEIVGDKAVIIFSFVGMVPQEISYTGQLNQNIILEGKAAGLDEVIVTGYFERKKDSYTGAATSFKGDELRAMSTGNVLSALSAIDPSFTQTVNNEMGSNPNALPEFVVRGSGSISSDLKSDYQGSPNAPTFIMDGFEVSAEKVFDLDPTRVRSMTILKDASATAIYGSRAANGVVIIETELPKIGELQVSYSGSLNLDVADLSDYNLMNSAEKFQFEQNSGLYTTTGKNPWGDERKLNAFNSIQRLVSQGIDTDWMAIPVEKVGVGQKHTVLLEGGDSKFRYGFNVNYNKVTGVMKGSGRRSVGVGIKLQYNYKKFKFSNYLSYDDVKSTNSPYGDYSQYSYLNPYYNPYNEDGTVSPILNKYSYYDRGNTTKVIYNGLYNATLPTRDESRYKDFLNNFSVEYNITKGLKFKSQISINSKQTVSDLYLPKGHLSFLNKDYDGSYRQSHRDLFSYDFSAVLSYFTSIGKHNINAVALVNSTEETSDFMSVKAINYPNQNFDHIGLGSGFIEGASPSGSYVIKRLIGVVGNLNYNYDNKYLFDASVRNDASSLFGSESRWGTFGSIGLGWNLHNESLLKNLGVFDQLKVRGSWGITGGQKFYAYQALSTLSYTDDRIDDISYGDYSGAILKALGNKNLRWQRIEKRNIGVDFEVFNRRITGYFNVYNDLSKDVLVDVSLAPSTGFSSYKENLGEVENAGFEVNLRGVIVKNKTNSIQWDVFFNAVHNVNTLKKISNGLAEFNNSQDSDVGNQTKVRYIEGESINTIWANESLGIDPATGKEVFSNLDGEMVDEWSSENYKPFANRDPDLYGNFGTRFRYKGIEMNASFAFSYGGYIYNQTLVNKVENIDPNENGDKRILTDKWQKPGDVAQYTGYDALLPTFTYPTSRFIEKNNYVQLQTLGLSYEFAKKQLQHFGIDRLRLSAIGNNVFRVSTVEMERGVQYPFARTYSLALKVTF